MSSLASLISNVKVNTASNSLLQKDLKNKRKRTEMQVDHTSMSTLLTCLPFSEQKAQKKPKKDIVKINSTKSSEPQVVVFDGSSLQKKSTFQDKADKKAFMVTAVVFIVRGRD